MGDLPQDRRNNKDSCGMLILLSEKLLQTKNFIRYSKLVQGVRFVWSSFFAVCFYWFISLTVLLFHASASIHSSLYMPVCHLCVDVCLSVYLSIKLSVGPSVYRAFCLSVYQASVCLSSYLFFCLSLSSCLSVYRSVCQSVKLSAYQSVFLSAQSTPLYLSLATNRYPTVHLWI